MSSSSDTDMFVPIPNLEELEQGDILRGLFLPVLSLDDLSGVSPPAGDSAPWDADFDLAAHLESQDTDARCRCVVARVRYEQSLCIVVSRSCDLVQRFKGKIEHKAFLVAPLRTIHNDTRANEAKMTRLRANSVSFYTARFHIPQIGGFPDEYVVDLARIFPIPKDYYDLALKGKILEMTPRSRARFKLKLAHHFGKATDEPEQQLMDEISEADEQGVERIEQNFPLPRRQ